MTQNDIAEIAGSIDLVESSAADRFIRSVTKKIDEEIESEIGKMDGAVVPADKDGEATCAAMTVSDALRAIHIASLRIIFRVLPNSIEKIIMVKVMEISEKIGARLAARYVLRSIPFLGQALSVTVGYLEEKTFNKELEDNIRGVLGIRGNEFCAYPLRKMISHDAVKKKNLMRHQVRKVKKVHTRIYKDRRYNGAGADF